MSTIKDSKVIAKKVINNDTLKKAIADCYDLDFLQALVNSHIKNVEKRAFDKLTKEEQLKQIETENLILAVKTKIKELNGIKKDFCNTYYKEVLTENQMKKKALRMIKAEFQKTGNYLHVFGSYSKQKDRRLNSTTFGQLIDRPIIESQLEQALKSHTLCLKALTKKNIENIAISGFKVEYYIRAIAVLATCKAKKFSEIKKREKPVFN